MYTLLYAPQPTDLRPRRRAVITDDTAADFDLAQLADHGGEVDELDSYELEERELLFAAWCAEVDAGDPPF